MRLFTFLVLEVLLSPITLTSYSLMTLWALAVSQQQQISITAIAPLSCRWLQHLQGERLDPVADSLIKTLPSLTPTLKWGVVGPTLLAMNLSGYTPKIFTVPPAGTENLGNMINTRTRFFDQALTQHLDTVEQVVILGAGFDTRLFKFCLGRNLALFEVDQPGTQRVKKQALRNSGLSLGEVSFVEVNFNQENWIEKLTAAGFKKGKKTFFLWEGVTYYLTEAVVRQSLRAMAEVSGDGSAIAFDFFSKDFIQGKKGWWWIKPGLGVLDWIGEPFYFGISDTNTKIALQALLTSNGFQLDKCQLMGNQNKAHQSNFLFGGLAIATVSLTDNQR